MSFFIKMSVFIAIVIFFIPADPGETGPDGKALRTIGMFDAYGLAQAVYNDMSGFCDRNPAACETGGSVKETFEAKARTAARMVHDYLSPARVQPPAASAGRPVVTGSVEARAVPVVALPLPPRKPDPRG